MLQCLVYIGCHELTTPNRHTAYHSPIGHAPHTFKGIIIALTPTCGSRLDVGDDETRWLPFHSSCLHGDLPRIRLVNLISGGGLESPVTVAC